MEFAFVVAMRGVGAVDVAVAGLQEAQDAGFVYRAGTNIVGESAEDYAVPAIVGV